MSFTLRRGETLGLVGESGCGKSTTGLAVLRMLKPTAGRILFEGADITHHDKERMRPVRRRMQMVYQDPYGSLNPRMKVRDIIGEPLEGHGLANDQGAYRRRVEQLIAVVGLLPDMAERYPHELSGGQRQRVNIARGFLPELPVLLLDEPTASLDAVNRAAVVDLIAEKKRRGTAIIAVVHDDDVRTAIADTVIDITRFAAAA